MDTLVKLVGRNIKDIRKLKKLTQEDLAERCGLQTSYLAGVERGDRNITLQTLEKIIVGLEEAPINMFKFETLITDEYFKKKELIMMLQNMVEERNETEILLILNIATEIFNTYEKGKSQ